MGQISYGCIARQEYVCLANTTLKSNDYLNTLAVSTQQIFEKLLKHVIDVELPCTPEVIRLLRTHKLRPMIICLRTHYPNINDFIGNIGVIDSVYFDTRYPGDSFYCIDSYELRTCYDSLNKAIDWFYSSVKLKTLYDLYIEVTGLNDTIDRFPDTEESRDLLRALTGFNYITFND